MYHNELNDKINKYNKKLLNIYNSINYNIYSNNLKDIKEYKEEIIFNNNKYIVYY